MKVNSAAHKRRVKRTTAAIVLASAIVVVIAAAAVLGLFPGGDAQSPQDTVPGHVAVGAAAPDFTALSSSGANLTLSDLKGSVVVLSFIYGAKTGGGDCAEDSNSQVNFLKSMDYQYSPKGVTIVLMDAGYIVSGGNTSENEFINFGYDHHVGDITVVADSLENKIAERYGVSRLPTTFVISRDGVVTQRLEGLALTAQLSAGIEAEAGAPFFREDDDTFFDLFGPGAEGGEERPITPAQALFRGFDMARSLSDNIWMVDGGKNMTAGSENPVRWLVLSSTGDIAIKVAASNVDTGEVWTSDAVALERIPDEEAEQILANVPHAGDGALYTALLSISAPSVGYCQISAEVFSNESGGRIYTGAAYLLAW